MKLTITQLRRIIKEEVSRVVEAGSPDYAARKARANIIDNYGLDVVADKALINGAMKAFKDYLAKGLDAEKAEEQASFDLEDGKFGVMPGYEDFDLGGSNVARVSRLT